MRNLYIGLVLFLGIGLFSCNSDRDAARERTSARQAGRDAYRAAQSAKRDIKQAEREVEHAGKEFREGWNEERNNDKGRRTTR